MIIKLKQNPDKEQVARLKEWLTNQGVEVRPTVGENITILGLVGDTTKIDASLINALEIVEAVKRIQEPYKEANRRFHPEDTVITLENGTKIGGNNFTVIAGPCSVESKEQIIEVAKAVKKSGATILRGGAFKPRTSPYAFQGMGAEGIELLLAAKKETGLPIVTEIMESSQLELCDDVDIIQVGARNMQNFELLKRLGKIDKPILLKRGLSATYQELIMSAEYIMAGGNRNVILCERGIRTFERMTRNTLDISAVPVLKEETHLPVIIDPSHAAGMSRMVEPLSLAATAAGAHGMIIEVHNDPEHALCDGPQSLKPETFDNVAKKIFKLHDALAELS
ncbi:3-deoxy-7-phosphoheptulonate synthase [Gallicola sp. Sow4_E12]|uniref:3-deoxy-7-phosphoheptulonate synthase n=1 Tax=Gallicola sp. Sow4_E12 TaxID=3438785 RepID=UPI003F8F8FE3